MSRTRQHHAVRLAVGALLLMCLGAGCAASGTVATPPDGVYVGVYEPGVPQSYGPVADFTASVGVQPTLVLYYSGWFEGFRLSFARQVSSHGAIPMVQIEPAGVSVSAIAVGKYDRFLAAYARGVRDYGRQVVIGFGHEMNGTWYSWGWHHASPQVWVAAWRHVVTVFRRAGADNVIWLWAVNAVGPTAGPPAYWWPGASYVTWAGVDGYYVQAGDTFSRIFGPTITAIRRLTHKPMLISETAVGPAAGKATQIPGLFAGVRQDHLIGAVWFDAAQDNGILHEDWRLEGNKAAVAAFRAGVESLR